MLIKAIVFAFGGMSIGLLAYGSGMLVGYVINWFYGPLPSMVTNPFFVALTAITFAGLMVFLGVRFVMMIVALLDMLRS